MAYALHSRKKHRASVEMAYHVLDVIESILESSEDGRTHELKSSCERPEILDTEQFNSF